MFEALEKKINEALEKAIADVVRGLAELAKSCDVELSNVVVDSKYGQFKISGKIRITLKEEETNK